MSRVLPVRGGPAIRSPRGPNCQSSTGPWDRAARQPVRHVRVRAAGTRFQDSASRTASALFRRRCGPAPGGLRRRHTGVGLRITLPPKTTGTVGKAVAIDTALGDEGGRHGFTVGWGSKKPLDQFRGVCGPGRPSGHGSGFAAGPRPRAEELAKAVRADSQRRSGWPWRSQPPRASCSCHHFWAHSCGECPADRPGSGPLRGWASSGPRRPVPRDPPRFPFLGGCVCLWGR